MSSFPGEADIVKHRADERRGAVNGRRAKPFFTDQADRARLHDFLVFREMEC